MVKLSERQTIWKKKKKKAFLSRTCREKDDKKACTQTSVTYYSANMFFVSDIILLSRIPRINLGKFNPLAFILFLMLIYFQLFTSLESTSYKISN